MTTKIPSQSPNDLVKIVDRPEWHEFMGRVAEPYSFIYGKAKPDTPAVKRDTSNRCIIASSSMEAEVDAVEPYKFFSAKDCAIQGCKARAKSIGDVKAIRFWQVLPNTDWKVQLAKLRSNTGNRLKLLGDVPLNADGSFAAEIPCETPYVMAGVDSDGNTLMRDQTPQSLRKGEIRTCTGCHLHSKPGRPLNQSDAFKQLNNPFQVGINNFPTIQKGKVVAQTTNVPAMVDYAKDVYPILERRCNSCHAGDQAAGGLRLDIPGSALFSAANPSASSTWYRIAWDFRQSLVPNKISYDPVNPNNFSLEKPNSSKYMNAVFAVESLFLWKILNQRVDGRTDSTYAKDVDFGSNHPVSISDDEIRTIRDWIDSGAYSSQP